MKYASNWVPCAALTLTGCCSFSTQELAHSLREDDVRCLASEDDMTVASPYSVETTANLVRDVRAYLVAIETLLEVEMPSSLHVQFPPVDMPDIRIQERDDGSLHIENFSVPSHHVDGPVWFDEAVAEEFEHRKLEEDGSFAPIPLPDSLRSARDLHEAYTIEDVLDWEEDARAIAAGEEEPFYAGRPLAHSLLRFLLARTPGDSLRVQLERIEAMEREELRALGPEWKAWLDALPSA